MASDLATILAGGVGVLVGGGVKAWETWRARAHEKTSVLEAIKAEVAALAAIAEHRDYLGVFQAQRDAFQARIDAGDDDGRGQLGVLQTGDDFFAVFDALRSKLGLLEPLHAEVIVGFYVMARAVLINYGPESPWTQEESYLPDLLNVMTQDIEALRAALLMAKQIRRFGTPNEKRTPSPESLRDLYADLARKQSPEVVAK